MSVSAASNPLEDHPLALVQAPDSALPEPRLDPFPLQTMALHNLWAVVRPLVRFNTHGALDTVLFDDPGYFSEQFLGQVVPAQVSSNFLFLSFCLC